GGTTGSQVRYDHTNWRRPNRCVPGTPPPPEAVWPGGRNGYPDIHDAPTIEVPVVNCDPPPTTAGRWAARLSTVAAATREMSGVARGIAADGAIGALAAAGAVALGAGQVVLRLAETALRALHRLVPLVVTAAVLAGVAQLVPWERIRPLAADAAHFVAGRLHAPTPGSASAPPATAPPSTTAAPTTVVADPQPTAPQVVDGTPLAEAGPTLVADTPEVPYGVSPLTPEVVARVRPGMTLAEVTRAVGITADYPGYLPGQLALLPAPLRSERDDPTSTATWAARTWTAGGFQPCQLLVTFRDDRAVHVVRSGAPQCPQGAIS
ncbi:MAG: hypothetical protein ACOYN0_17820, partial [Phycisphaerales bacterium]